MQIGQGGEGSSVWGDLRIVAAVAYLRCNPHKLNPPPPQDIWGRGSVAGGASTVRCVFRYKPPSPESHHRSIAGLPRRHESSHSHPRSLPWPASRLLCSDIGCGCVCARPRDRFGGPHGGALCAVLALCTKFGRFRDPPPCPREASEGKGPQRRPQKRLDRRLEEVAKAVGGGYCRLQMPLRLALGVRGTVAGRRLGALEGGGGGVPPPLMLE